MVWKKYIILILLLVIICLSWITADKIYQIIYTRGFVDGINKTVQILEERQKKRIKIPLYNFDLKNIT